MHKRHYIMLLLIGSDFLFHTFTTIKVSNLNTKYNISMQGWMDGDMCIKENVRRLSKSNIIYLMCTNWVVGRGAWWYKFLQFWRHFGHLMLVCFIVCKHSINKLSWALFTLFVDDLSKKREKKDEWIDFGSQNKVWPSSLIYTHKYRHMYVYNQPTCISPSSLNNPFNSIFEHKM
jgi:hypothetical protein